MLLPSRSLPGDVGDRQPRLRLAVTCPPAVALFRLALKKAEFLAPVVLADLGGPRRAGRGRRPDPSRAGAADQINPVGRDLPPRLGREFFDRDLVTDADAVLLAAGLDHG